MRLYLQLHGGSSKSSSSTIKQSAPGSTAAATIDTATAGEREKVREQLASARGRSYTNKTSGTSWVDTVKKSLLGE